MPGPATAPGVSKSPGGRTIVRPFGPWYVTAPSPLTPSVTTRESSVGIQRAGSYTWSTPTMEFTPQQIEEDPEQPRQMFGRPDEHGRPEQRRHHREIHTDLGDACRQ